MRLYTFTFLNRCCIHFHMGGLFSNRVVPWPSKTSHLLKPCNPTCNYSIKDHSHSMKDRKEGLHLFFVHDTWCSNYISTTSLSCTSQLHALTYSTSPSWSTHLYSIQFLHMLAWDLGIGCASTVEEMEALILFSEVDPLLLVVGALELVVEELELYFFLHMSKFLSSSNFWFSHVFDLVLWVVPFWHPFSWPRQVSSV